MGRDSEGHNAKIFEDFLLYDFLVDELMENYSIMPSLKESVLNNRNFRGIFHSEEYQNQFWECGGQGAE
jgi:hypothetical protein